MWDYWLTKMTSMLFPSHKILKNKANSIWALSNTSGSPEKKPYMSVGDVIKTLRKFSSNFFELVNIGN